MKASLIDRSNYYRGMLVLIGRDRIVHPDERKLAIELGRLLDFDKRFCEAAIADLLENVHINEDPIFFEERKIAECYLRDGLKVSLIDNELDAREMGWLDTVARVNRLPEGWVQKEYEKISPGGPKASTPADYEIRKYL
jgi:hypothetical protein